MQIPPSREWIRRREKADNLNPSNGEFLQRTRFCMALVVALCGVLTLRAAVGPDYKRPTNAIPQSFEDSEVGTWKVGEPSDGLPRGDWWKMFNDEALNNLETLAAWNNQDLRAAVARVDQARALAR